MTYVLPHTCNLSLSVWTYTMSVTSPPCMQFMYIYRERERSLNLSHMHLSPNYLDSDGHQNSPAHIQFISLQTCAMWHTSQHMKFVAVSETYTARCIFSFTQFISLQPCAMKCTSSMHMKFIALPQTYTATFIFLTSLSLSLRSKQTGCDNWSPSVYPPIVATDSG